MTAKLEIEIDEASYNTAKKRLLSLKELATPVNDAVMFDAVMKKLDRLENTVWFLVCSMIIVLVGTIGTMITLFGK